MFGLEMTVGSARGGFFLSGKNSNAVTDLTLSCSVIHQLYPYYLRNVSHSRLSHLNIISSGQSTSHTTQPCPRRPRANFRVRNGDVRRISRRHERLVRHLPKLMRKVERSIRIFPSTLRKHLGMSTPVAHRSTIREKKVTSLLKRLASTNGTIEAPKPVQQRRSTARVHARTAAP